MATQTVEFAAPSGMTLTAKLFAIGSDTVVQSVSASAATNRKGIYSAAYTDAPAAEYLLVIMDASSVAIAIWGVTLTLTTATFRAYERADVKAVRGNETAALNLQQSCLAFATGTVLTDGGNTATTFKIDSTLGAKVADYFGDGSGGMVLDFVLGTANEWQTRRVIAFNTTTDFVTVEQAFSAVPTANDAFILAGRITELS